MDHRKPPAQVISTKSGGTELGTKVIKDAIDAQAGRITVERSEGVGMTFRICLPLIPPKAPAKLRATS